MNKTIIGIYGPSGQGKSSTIKRVCQLILANFPAASHNPITIDYSVDIFVVITIGKVTVGIESQGDPNSRLAESLKEFVNQNCDLIVCATRTSGQTVHAVEKMYSKHGYENIWVTNYRSNQKHQDKLNDLSAQHIIELIQKLLTNKI